MENANANVDEPGIPGQPTTEDPGHRPRVRRPRRESREERIRLWVMTLTPIVTAVATIVVTMLNR